MTDRKRNKIDDSSLSLFSILFEAFEEEVDDEGYEERKVQVSLMEGNHSTHLISSHSSLDSQVAFSPPLHSLLLHLISSLSLFSLVSVDDDEEMDDRYVRKMRNQCHNRLPVRSGCFRPCIEKVFAEAR